MGIKKVQESEITHPLEKKEKEYKKRKRKKVLLPPLLV
jgi:hypothetical protein